MKFKFYILLLSFFVSYTTSSVAQPPSYGKAIRLNGSTDYVEIGNMGVMPEKGSIAFWCNAFDLGSYRNVLTTGDLTGCTNGNNAIRFEVNGGNFSAAINGAGSDCSTSGTVYTNSMVSFSPVHIVFAWNKTTNTIKGYLNGKMVFDQEQTSWPTHFSAVKIGVGWDINRKWRGNIDEVTFWNKELSAAEAGKVMNDQFSATDVNLVAYYNFDNNSINGAGHTITNIRNPGTFDGTTIGATTSPVFIASFTDPSFGEAKSFGEGAEQSGFLCNDLPVFYKTVLPADGKYRIYMEATNTGSGNDGYLYLSGYDQRKGNGNIFNRTPANYLAAGSTALDSVDLYCRSAADTIYFKISQANQCFNYKISYKLIGTPTDNDVEPNNTFEEATKFNIGDTVKGHIGYVAGNAVTDGFDYYKTVLPADGKYRIYMEGINTGNGQGLLYVSGYDQRKAGGNLFNNTIAYYTYGGDISKDSIDFYCRSAGDTIYFRVSQANQCFNYKISYKLIGTPTDNDVEPNNTFEQATKFIIGDTVKGHIGYVAGNAVSDAVDYFKTVLPADGKYRIYMEATNTGNGQGLLNVSGYDQRQGDGNLFNRTPAYYTYGGDTSKDSVDLFSRAQGDTLYFRVTQSSQCFNYKITYKQIGAPSDNDLEPNNTFSEATTLNIADTAKGHIGYVSGGSVSDQVDYYKTLIPADGTVRIYMEATNTGNGQGLLNVSGYDQRQGNGNLFNRTPAYYSYGGDVTKDSVDLYCRSAGDTFYFRVTQSAQTYNYKISYKILPHTNITNNKDVEPNNTLSQASLLNAKDSVIGHLGYISGSLYDDADYFKTKLPSKGTMVMRLQTINTGSSQGLFSITLFDKNKNQAYSETVAYYNSGGEVTNSVINISCQTADSFYIRLNSANSCYSYKLSYEVTLGADTTVYTCAGCTIDISKLYNTAPFSTVKYEDLSSAGTAVDPRSVKGGTYMLSVVNGSNECSRDTAIITVSSGQIIRFDSIPDKVYGDAPFVVKATSSAGLSVTYKILSGPATVSRDTVTVTGVGSVTVRAEQAGNETYNYALADRTFNVKKAGATITLTDLTRVYTGNAITPGAVTDPPALPVSYTFDGNTNAPVNAGTYQVIATINSTDYSGSTTGTFVIQKANQTVTLTPVPNKEYGNAPFIVNAAATSGLPVTFSLTTSPSDIASVDKNTITINGIGTVVVTAVQNGNENYNPTDAVADTFVINKGNQTITVADIGDRRIGDTIILRATASSTLPVTYSIVTTPASGVGRLSGDTIVLISDTGRATVTINQAGNQFYDPTQVQKSFRVLGKQQTIAFAAIANKTLGDPPFAVSATATSGLPVTFKIISGPAIINRDSITLTNNGTVVVEATQGGNNHFASAPAIQQSFTIIRKYADLTVQNVTSTNVDIAPNDTIDLSWKVSNVGETSSAITWTEKMYIQSVSGANRTLLKQAPFNNDGVINVGQTISRGEKVIIPAQLNVGDQGVFVVELVPASATAEAAGDQANNTGVQQTASAVRKILLLQVSASQVTEGSTEGVTATVSRTASLADPLTVNVSFGNLARFSFPSTVTIPAGQSATTFTITATNNTGLEGTVADSLRVSATNFPGSAVSLSILDDDKPSLTFTQLPVEAMEGQTVTFKISTDQTLKQPLQVFLTSENQKRFLVPSSVTIPAGAQSADVTVKLEQNTIPELDVAVKLVAGAANHNSTNAIVQLKDDDLPGLELIVQTNIISEAAGYYATQATLRRKAGSNPIAFTANLSSGSTNSLLLPASVVLAAGENEKTFNIGVVDNTLVDGDRKVSITASIFVNSCGCSAPSTSSGSVSGSVTVTDNDGAALEITATQITLPEGLSPAGYVRITRNTSTNNALSVSLSSSNKGEAIIGTTAVIPAGETFVDVPVTTINDRTADGNQQVYFQASSAGYSTGSIMVVVTDANKPDLQIPAVKLSNQAVQPMALINYQVFVKNSGFATTPAGVKVRGYLSQDNLIDNSDSLISEDITSEAIPAGETLQILNAAKVYMTPGQYKLLYIVNPDLTLSELLTTNNTSNPVNLTINPNYTATAVVDLPYFVKGAGIPISGLASMTDGSAAANQKVEVYLVTNGVRRTLSATTDAAGRYTTQFVPLANEAGHYTVGAGYPGLGTTKEQDNFDILGVRINNGQIPQLKVTLKDTLRGAIAIQNLSNKGLTNFSLAPVSLPNGAYIIFETIPVLAGNATVNLNYIITASTLSPGNNFEVANLNAFSNEGTIQPVSLFYYSQAPNAYVEANISTINVTASQSIGERQVEFRLVNKGKGSTGDININLPQIGWLSSVTPVKLPSLETGDSAIVILKFMSSSDVPFNYPITGTIGVNTQNGNSFSIPFSFTKVSETVGSVKVTVTNQFTYFSNAAPKVKGAHVIIKNYYTGHVYADGYTDSTGVLTAAGIPEGTHRITVQKDQHQPYNGTLTINPGQTLETSVFLNYQAITFSWNVVPTGIEDQYDITLETKFETNVPIPVVIIDMPKTMPQLSGSETYAFNVNLTNHGLVTANEVTLGLPGGDAEYEFVTNYVPGDLLAQQSIQVPVIMRRRTQAPTGGRASIEGISQFLGVQGPQYRSAAGAGDCQGFTSVTYSYKCNIATGLWEKGGAMFSYSGRKCSSPVPAYTGVPIDVGGIPTSDNGGYNDVPCATCGPASFTGAATTPTEPAAAQKKTCVQCINDIIGVVQGCGGPGGAAVGAGSCVLGNWLDNKAAAEYLTCIPGAIPSPIGCAKGISDALNDCSSSQSSARNARTDGSAGKAAKGSPLGAAYDKIAESLNLVKDAYEARENWGKEYFGDMIFSDAWDHFSALIEPYVANLDSIRPDGQTSILAAMSGYEIQPSVINAFFTRWNTSLHARRQGVLVPNTQYPDIINWTKVKGYSDYMIHATIQAINKGFASVYDMYEKEYKALNELLDKQSQAVCASVTIQLSQRLTMTREAFEGTLEIFNGHPTDKMDSLSVNIKITDANGVPSNGLFEIQTKSLYNLADITGTGAIASQQKGSVKFLFIPENGAAPAASKVYNFSGSVTYWDPYAGGMVTMPLSSVALTVNPSPNLMLHYFMERNILGDDALTSPAIEPSIPAELAVMVENQGYGAAVNMVISSAQPKIVENEKGLAINFSLIGSNFQGQPKKLGVTDINFGTIPALQTRIGQWYFTSSLLGKFVSYDAKVVHSNSFGNPDLSLVKGVKLHELTKSIRLYGNLEDGINDFLVNDIFDTKDVPDVIYFSQGNRTAKVYEAASASFSAPVMPPTFTNTLTVTASSTGWNYMKLDDPGKKLYEIASVTRSDGQVIPLNNVWLSFVTLPAGKAPVYENKFHFVDTFSSTQPFTYTVIWKPKNLDVPKVDSIAGLPKDITSTQVQNVQVIFNKRIDPATFTYEDLTLTFQGGQNIINSSAAITQTDTATFNVDLSMLTTGNGFYALTVQAANVSDVFGINGSVGKQASWTQFLDVPAVQAFQGIPEGRLASSFDKIQVMFNIPIDAATVTPSRFTILKDSLVQPVQLTIDSVRADKKLFYLSGLKNLSQNGQYELFVDLPNIKSANQVSGVQKQSTILTVDNSGPIVLSLEKSQTGGLDAQHVPYVNIKFNEDVIGFNTASVSLTRNGEVLPLRVDNLSNTDLKTWMAGNFGTLTYSDGNYTFTVDLSGIKDRLGNVGKGTQQISWTVNRAAIVSISSLSVTPDLGYSNTDGVTSIQSLEVKFKVNANASKVTISQTDLSGEVVLTTVSNVAAGDVSVPVTLTTGGNTGIKVSATLENGAEGKATRSLYLDQVSLSGKWLFDANQVLSKQVDTMQIALSAKLLNDAGFLNSIQLKRNGTAVSTTGISFKALNDSLYEVRGIRGAASLDGDYELLFNLPAFSKYSSGKTGSAVVSATWTLRLPNHPPISKAGSNITIIEPGAVNLNGSRSTDPDSDPITYRWIAPAGIALSDSTSATPSFTVSVTEQGNNYPFLLIVSDGKAFTTDVVNVTVNISNNEYYRSMITGNWNDAATWESSADSINWKKAFISPNDNSKTVTIQSGHTVTVKQKVTIDETFVTPGATLSVDTSSTLTVLHNGLTLKSTADSTGMIGSSAGKIVGNVIVERYIPARRAWRLLTVPFTNSQTINAAWQEGGVNIPGYGTHITGESVEKGFDTGSSASSIQQYNQATNSFEAVGSTLSPLSNNPGYFLLVRGDRTVDLSLGRSAPATNTVLRAMGTLKTGTQPSITVQAEGFTLIGNPYASTIDFSKIVRTNVPNRFFVWDPKRGATGAFVLFDADNGYAPLNSGGSYTGANSLIASGQAFFVEGRGTAGSIGIGENSKSNGQRNAFRSNDGQDEKLLINLHSVNTDNETLLVDAAQAKYNNLYSTGVTDEDAGKPENIEENVAIVRNNKKLTVEKRPLVDGTDTVFLKLYHMKQMDYQYEFIPANFTPATLSAHLEDTYLKTSKKLSLDAITTVPFSITADAASGDADRFRIVFKSSLEILPIDIKVKGHTKDAGVQVDWDVASETNIHHYDVEKSVDGVNFEKVINVVAAGNNNTERNYSWFDKNPINGDNFYRIKSVDNAGQVKYSNVVIVKIGNGKSSIVIYPNPVTNKAIFVQLNNQPKGNYIVQLYNNLGQQLMNVTVNHTGGSATQRIPLKSIVSKGMYQLHITNGETKLTQQIMVE
ncbi:MAG: carboxypeptidase regulatory-like protein [Segetibacter sp.]|nr:carboxypeptidase regulatory-like protein [Segetibacter sp.]